MSSNLPKVSTKQLNNDIQNRVREQHQAETKQTAEALLQGGVTGTQRFKTTRTGMLLGQVQMAKSFESIATISSLQILKQVKESKEYKNLKGTKLPDGSILKGTWADFCKVIGESTSHIDERLKNLEVFGERALENMQAIGMGIRDLRRLRQLSEDEKAVLLEGDALKVQDREEALIIIEEMSTNHRQEKNSLKEKVEDLEQASQAADQLLEKKGKQIQALEKELEIAKCANSPAKVKQLEAERYQLLSMAVIESKFAIFKGLSAFEDAVIAIRETDHPCDLDDEYQNSMRDIISRMMEGSARAGLDQLIFDALKAEMALCGKEL